MPRNENKPPAKSTAKLQALGKAVSYTSVYAPKLLEPIDRKLARAEKLQGTVAMQGADLWTAYELSWLNLNGQPQCGILNWQVPQNSPCMLESKSVKLYLNSLNQSQFSNRQALQTCIEKDFREKLGALGHLEILNINDFQPKSTKLEGICLDELNVTLSHYQHDARLLTLPPNSNEQLKQRLFTHNFRSNCPVSDQPDWATLIIDYEGAAPNLEGLYAYLISYRQTSGFHELCVEQIFEDIMHRLKPKHLSVYARFLRRGGIDINPFRSTYQQMPDEIRIARQ